MTQRPGRASSDRTPQTLACPFGQPRWIGETLVARLRTTGLDGHTITADPARTVVLGSSFGGLAALFTVAQAPDVVGAACALSPSLWRYPGGQFGAVLSRANAAARIRVWLGAGRYENPEPMPSLAESLDRDRVEVQSHVPSGGHDRTWWAPAMIDTAINAFGR